MSAGRPGWGQVVAGLVVITVGLIFLLERLDWGWPLDFGRLWPLIVIAVGAGRLIGGGEKKRHDAYLILFIGIWLLVNTLQLFDLYWGISWPLVLVAVGLALLLSSAGGAARGRGVFLIALGVLFQAIVLGLFGLGFDNAWPLFVVAAGIWIILRAFDGGRRPRRPAEKEGTGHEES